MMAASRRSHSPSRSPSLAQNGSAPLTTGERRSINLQDMQEIAADIKNTLSAVISDLRRDIQAINLRVEEVEHTAARHDASLCQVQQVTESHAIHLRELQQHLEDLDNRGRRHNLKVRGLPENIEPNRLTQTTLALFNDILERP